MSQKEGRVPLVVFVTGCSSGIGRELALTFHAANCRVFASARNPRSLDTLQAVGIEVVQLDIKDRTSIENAVDEIISKAGRIDILVNNAGVSSYWPSIDAPMEEVRNVMETNFFGLVALTQLVATKSMIPRRSGRIVQISSIAGETTTPWNGVYGASKAAVTHYSDALRVELAPFNVKVITVKPGGVKSDIAKNATSTLQRTKNSIYDRIWDYIVMRANTSQHGPMPTEKFAEDVVGKVLSNPPPKCIINGTNSTGMRLLSHLPYGLVDWYFSRRFGLSALAKMVRAEKKND